MDRQLWYDRWGNPIDDVTAARLLADRVYSRVGLTEVTSKSDATIKWRISTVWLGIDHNHRDTGDPIIFETMVFAGDTAHDEMCDRYSTELEAEVGHTEVVALVAATVPDEVIRDITA